MKFLFLAWVVAFSCYVRPSLSRRVVPQLQDILQDDQEVWADSSIGKHKSLNSTVVNHGPTQLETFAHHKSQWQERRHAAPRSELHAASSSSFALPQLAERPNVNATKVLDVAAKSPLANDTTVVGRVAQTLLAGSRNTTLDIIAGPTANQSHAQLSDNATMPTRPKQELANSTALLEGRHSNVSVPGKNSSEKDLPKPAYEAMLEAAGYAAHKSAYLLGALCLFCCCTSCLCLESHFRRKDRLRMKHLRDNTPAMSVHSIQGDESSGLGGLLAKGKQARGAQSSQRYKFGDLTRGFLNRGRSSGDDQ